MNSIGGSGVAGAHDTYPAREVACDVLIIGGGIAGLTVALSLPPDLRVVLLTKGALGESNTRYAQGGLAAAMGVDDNPDLHLADTIAAGAGLVDETAACALVAEAREAVAWLVAEGTNFDRAGQSNANETFALGREAAHSRRRVLHARGDATGAEIERALVAAITSRPGATILDATLALELTVSDGVCAGALLRRAGVEVVVRARRGVVLANGGAGRLWLRTSNPEGATADGLSLAWRAGATLADLEFAQFHPTVLVPPTHPAEAFLISEAVRGEGAYLRNARGERFMPRYAAEAELAPRDVVARAILSETLAERSASAFLDLRHLPAQAMRERFPTIAATCARYGLDLARDLIPVAPAAHYFMGGVAVDASARTTVPRLYAVGEVACTGVHGANRLASNSLLEGLVFGRRAARVIAANAGDEDVWPRTPSLPGETLSSTGVVIRQAEASAPVAAETRARIRGLMWERVSLRRDAEGLTSALTELRELATGGACDAETASMLFAAQAITLAALARTESRGAHYRLDFLERDARRDGRHSLLTPTPIVGERIRNMEVVAHA